MSLVFYYAPKSTAVTVHWALEELGIPYERVDIDLAARDQDKAGYRSLNPNGKVPLVVHDGVAIFESAAILIHLGETFGVERDLFPPPGFDRAEAVKWIVWTNATLAPAVGRFLAGRTEGAQKELEQLLGIVDADLRRKEFLAAGTFSLADVHLASFVDWIGRLGIALATWPALQAWVRRCIDRPGHVRAEAA